MSAEIQRLQDRRRELTDLWDTQFNAGQWDDADRTMATIRKLTRLISYLIYEATARPARTQVLDTPDARDQLGGGKRMSDLAERVGWLEAALKELSQDSDDAWDQLERYLAHFGDWS